MSDSYERALFLCIPESYRFAFELEAGQLTYLIVLSKTQEPIVGSLSPELIPLLTRIEDWGLSNTLSFVGDTLEVLHRPSEVPEWISVSTLVPEVAFCVGNLINATGFSPFDSLDPI